MLPAFLDPAELEAGVDEAGRGALAGPVVAAAVVWNAEVTGGPAARIRDSKRLTRLQREALRPYIEDEAVAWSVCFVPPEDVDRLNVWGATMAAMRGALDGLDVDVDRVLVDGPHFAGYASRRTGELVPYTCIEGGDDAVLSIAAASVLAKTHRDAHVRAALAPAHPGYGWEGNVGYGSAEHVRAIRELGLTPHHRHSFGPCRPGVAPPTTRIG